MFALLFDDIDFNKGEGDESEMVMDVGREGGRDEGRLTSWRELE